MRNVGPNLVDAVKAAQELLGWNLVHETSEGIASGYIVETEAYTAMDIASHSYNGQTPRNSSMFGPTGGVYVYFTYGMHYCVNIVTGQAGDGQAVLIRALQPVAGQPLMAARRHQSDVGQLTNGPAKLTQALGIGKAENGLFVNKGSIRLEPGLIDFSVIQTTRVGIRRGQDTPWRFYIAGNRFVSRT